MTLSVRRRFAISASVMSLGLLALVIIGGRFYSRLRESLPRIEGIAAVPGLHATLTVKRDAMGVPVVSGSDRLDVARGLGFLHAQDRFFQMDLLRRQAAGELAELFGPDAVEADAEARVHGFRGLAAQVLERAEAPDRELLEAYAAGVNAGLADLQEKPFEYLILRTEPREWAPTDSVLTLYAMALTLQGNRARYEASLNTLRDVYGEAGIAFFAPVVTDADAALDGSTASLPPIPSERLIDVRPAEPGRIRSLPRPVPSEFTPGSNAFAVSGSRTASGGAAMVASDMHLSLNVPNIWYRASLQWPGSEVTGVTLPGLPIVVAGSNGHIAWAFTNAEVDTTDLVIVEVPASDLTSLYRINGGLERIERRQEEIAVRGEDPVQVVVPWSAWGPLVASDASGRPLALHWTMHDPAAANLELTRLEQATNADEAIVIAHAAGIPTQNFIVADAGGNIAWTIAGQLPRRVGFGGRLPVSWYFGDRSWNGYVPPGQIPVVRNPPGGNLWSGNNRPLGGRAIEVLGDSGYARPARAAQIRDRLAELDDATPAALLRIQLDDDARFLSRWRERMLALLDEAATAGNRDRTALRSAIERWDGRAAVGSSGYRIVRAWRQEVASMVLEPIFLQCRQLNPDFEWQEFQYEPALWRILDEQPPHLLQSRYLLWNDLLLAAADRVSEALDDEGLTAERATWGRRNTLRMRHPLSGILPSPLRGLLDMEAVPLPGDNDMPRVQTPGFGASERFVVAPGREGEGIFHMPGGQSGHPLSPFYRAGHDAWVRGEPTPFLPGEALYTMELRPPAAR